MPIVVDDSPQRAVISWPEMMPPGAGPAVEGLDPAASIPTTEGLTTALEPLMSVPALSGEMAAIVYDGITGQELYNNGGETTLTPASSTKIATTAAALTARGPGYRIPTRVVEGEKPGEIILVAGGDITLSVDGTGFYEGAPSLADLADQVSEALGDQEITSITLDSSVFEGELRAPGVVASDIDVGGYTAFLTPFMTDGGRLDPAGANYSARRPDPSGFALDQFGSLLGAEAAVSKSGATASESAKELGVVYSAPMLRLAEQALLPSDNTLADALARQTALVDAKTASFESGAKATIDVLTAAGVPMDGAVLSDNSGLSVDNRLSPKTLASIVLMAANGERPEFSGIFAGLPVSGYSGSLGHRFTGESAAAVGDVRAKTGTLSNVNSLTGMLITQEGRLLTFALMFNGKADSSHVEPALDAVAAGIAGCGCQ